MNKRTHGTSPVVGVQKPSLGYAMPKGKQVVKLSRFEELKGIIRDGLDRFIQVGMALQQIKDDQLYLETHKTFESFCIEEFGMGIRHANRLRNAAEIAQNLLPSNSGTGPIGPTSESQVRPLTGLPAEAQKAAWDEAVEAADGKQPTAEQVVTAATKRRETPPEPRKKAKPSDNGHAKFDLTSWNSDCGKLVRQADQWAKDAGHCDARGHVTGDIAHRGLMRLLAELLRDGELAVKAYRKQVLQEE